ncbi:hypothetical protein [Tomitella gaofuii]|uniref:hypothetical protein n=1 Tax=Tomitella gaofuii TaxID=2760083 RepID=UPI0015F8B698|nr:hypothetical protein [Tomitella gaofuii]
MVLKLGPALSGPVGGAEPAPKPAPVTAPVPSNPVLRVVRPQAIRPMATGGLVLGPVIGRIGGSTVEQTPVSGSQTGTTWKTLHTVTVPSGETWLVSAAGTLRAGGFGSATAFVSLTGSLPSRTNSTSDMDCGGSVVATGAVVSLSVRGDSQFDTATFDGVVYTVRI